MLAACGRPCEGVAKIDEEGVLEAPQDADLPEHALGLLWTAQHVWNPLQGHLEPTVVSDTQCAMDCIEWRVDCRRSWTHGGAGRAY